MKRTNISLGLYLQSHCFTGFLLQEKERQAQKIKAGGRGKIEFLASSLSSVIFRVVVR